MWDKETKRIVNNSEDDICRMFNFAFAGISHKVELFPADIEPEHAKLAAHIYEKVNNGVYEAGFATCQQGYELRLPPFVRRAGGDWRRAWPRGAISSAAGSSRPTGDSSAHSFAFDAVYHGHFKCNVRRIIDYPNLQGYLLDLYQQPGIAATVRIDHIKRHYYFTHDDINPTRIVPIGPAMDLTKPHGRDRAYPVA